MTPQERNRVGVTFTVTEGEPAKIREIRIAGNQAFSGANAEVAVGTQRRRLAQLLPEGRPLFACQAQRRPRDAARVLPEPRLPRVGGRVDAGGDLARQAGDRDHDQRQGGPPYTVTASSWKASTSARRTTSSTLVTIRPGDPYRAESVAATTRAFVDRFGTFGYAFAKVDARPEIDRANGRVVVNLVAEPQRRSTCAASTWPATRARATR